MSKRLIFAGLLLTMTACGSSDPNLLNIRQSRAEGPDEFAVLPNEPLEIPENVASLQLPEPTPGGVNRADIVPERDVTLALGGSETARTRGGADPALIAYTTRFGVQPGIRQTLAAQDLEYRRANDGRLLERLFSVNVYFDAYEPLSLDQYAELERFRRAGVPTASAPPEPRDE